MRINTVSAGIVLGLALVSCNMNPAPQKSALTTLGVQKFEGWPGTIEGFEGQVKLSAYIQGSFVQIASVPVNTKGEFTLNLPVPKDEVLAVASFLVPQGCTSTVQVSEKNFLSQGFQLLFQPKGESDKYTELKSQSQFVVGSKYYQLTYTNKPFSISGELNCPPEIRQPTPKMVYKANLLAGWNILQIQKDSDTQSTITATTQVPADLKVWSAVPGQPVKAAN